MDIALGHSRLLGATGFTDDRWSGCRFAWQVYPRHRGWQLPAVLRRAASVPPRARTQPGACLVEDDAGSAYGVVHQEFRRHTASHHGDFREAAWSQSACSPFCVAHLYHGKYERLRGVHPRHFALRDAERRVSAHASCHAPVACHLGGVGNRQCRSAHGLLLPHPLVDVGNRSAGRHHGSHPSCLYHHRHDRDSRERVV